MRRGIVGTGDGRHGGESLRHCAGEFGGESPSVGFAGRVDPGVVDPVFPVELGEDIANELRILVPVVGGGVGRGFPCALGATCVFSPWG